MLVKLMEEMARWPHLHLGPLCVLCLILGVCLYCVLGACVLMVRLFRHVPEERSTPCYRTESHRPRRWIETEEADAMLQNIVRREHNRRD